MSDIRSPRLLYLKGALFLPPGLLASAILLLENPEPHVRFCLGYAGWGPRQLEQEMAAGSWLFSEATAKATLESNPTQLWDETVRGMGFDPAMLIVGKGLH